MLKTKQKIVYAVLAIVVFTPVLAAAAIPGVCPAGQSCASGIPVPLPRFGVGGIIGCVLGSPACQSTATDLIMAVIDLILWIAGLLAVLFIIIGGVRYITAHGNEEQAESAKGTLTHAIIGLVIILLSFVIVRIISNALITGIT